MSRLYDETTHRLVTEISRNAHFTTAGFEEEATEILDAVAPLIAAKALREVADRLERANKEILRMKHQTERVTGKAEGVRLALSYVEEQLR